MQPGYGHHGQVMLPGKLFQFFCAHHGTIRDLDFTAKTAGGQAGQSAQALAVMARSWADIPVEVVTWSTDKVKAVL